MGYRFGDYSLDTMRYELRRTGIVVKLRPRVLEVLAYLITHRERLVSKQELLEQLWPQQFVGEATLHSHIRAARQAVGDTGQAQRVIQTRHGRGFRFVAELETDRQERGESATPPRPAMASPLAPSSSPVAGGPVLRPDDQGRAEVERPEAVVVDVEHKAVTVLCAGLVEASALAAQLGPEAMHRLMQACVATVQQMLPPYGGTLTHIGGDGFLALFGAPLAQEDHARRAVLAAVALQQALQECTAGVSPRVPLGIGVHTGPAVIGGLGEESHRLYTAVGETIEWASRLRQQAAPGAILLSAATQQLVQAEVQVDDGGMIGMAVGAAPLPVYRVRGIARRRSGVLGRRGRALSSFVGREREMAMLHERLQHAIQGQGQVLGIVGEPGIGKSRLLYEFAQSLGERSVTYCEGHCLAYGSTMPYLPVQDLLRQLCGIADTDGPEMITTKVHARLHTLGLAPTDVVPHLLSILGLTTDTDHQARLSPQAIKARTFAALQQVCLSSSRQQVLILAVENLHWSDPTSEEWLTTLVERIAGAAIFLLVTYRPGSRPAWLEHSYTTQISLPRLTPTDSLVLVQSAPQAGQLPGRLQRDVVGKAAGNPFFLEELTRAVVAHDSEHATLHIPDTIQAVLAARIDRLPPVAKRLLQAAAVIGVQVSIPLLQALAEVSEHTLAECLRHMQAAELLYETHFTPEPGYTFTHALTQEVAYGSLSHERRCAVHTQIVGALERCDPERLHEHVHQLAHHAFRGELWDKAVTYGRQAGEKALQRPAYREAVGSFELALKALTQLSETSGTCAQAIDLRLALRTALLPSGDRGRMLALLHEAESLALALDDPRRLGQVSACLANQFRSLGMYDKAIAVDKRALALGTSVGDVLLMGLANQYLAQTYFSQGNYRQAIECFEQTVAVFDKASRHEHSGQVIMPGVFSRYYLVRCHANLGTFAEGYALAEEGLRIAEAASDSASLMFAAWGAGLLVLRQGDPHRALLHLERAMAICQNTDHPANFRGIAVDLSAAYNLGGRVSDAMPLLAQAIEQSTVAKDRHCESLCCRAMGEAQLLLGHLEEARVLTARALALAQENKERGGQAYTLRLLGEIISRHEPLGRDQAKVAYQQALTLAEDLGMRPLVAHCHLGLGTLSAKIGQPQPARAELSMAIALYQALQMTFWLPQAEAALAQIAE